MKFALRVLRVFVLFGLLFLLLSLDFFPLAKGAEKTGEKALKAEAEKALRAKVERLKADYKEAVSLYRQRRYQEARTMFLRIAADAARNDLDPSNDLYLGFWVERGLRRYLKRTEGKLTEPEKEAQGLPLAPTSKAEARAEETRLTIEAERAHQEKVKTVLEEDFETAERLYKQGRYLEARPLLEKVARQKEAMGISFGWLAERRLKDYLSDIDVKIAEKEKIDALKTVADAQSQEKEKAKGEILSRYDEGMALYEAGDYPAAKKAFDEVARRQDEEDIELGWIVERGLTTYLARVDQKILEQEQKAAEARRFAREEEERRAQATQARARQAEFARLKLRYEQAIGLYKKGDYPQAKGLFLSVQRDKGDLNLGPEMEEGLRRYLVRIDEDIEAQRKQEQTAKLESSSQADQQRRKSLAELYYRDAKNNYDRRLYSRAREDAKKALEFNPQHQDAARLLAQMEGTAASSSTEGSSETPLPSKVREIETVARERYEKHLSDRLAKAKALLEEEKYEEALSYLEDIDELIRFAPIPPSDVIDGIKEELVDLLPQVREAAEAAQKMREDEARLTAAEIAEMEREKWEDIREEQTSQQIELAKLFMERKEFEKAEAILKSILMRETTEPRALVLLEVVRLERHMDEMARLREVADWELRKGKELGAELTIPWRDIYVYPPADVWRLLTERRKEVAALGLEPASPADLKVEENLKQFITFDFTDTPFGDVIEFIRTVGDINVVVDSAVVTPADMLTPITLRLTDVTIESALKHVLIQMNLAYIVKDGALFISDRVGVELMDEPVQVIYMIQDLTATVRDFVAPTMGFAGGGLEGGTLGDAPAFGDAPALESTRRVEEMDAFAQEFGEFEEEVPPTEGAAVSRALTPDQAGVQTEQLIRQVIDPDIWLVTGNSIRYRQGQLIVSAPPSTHKKIQRLLENLRRARAIQVSMDIRFIRCTDEFIEQVGVELSLQRTGAAHATYWGSVTSSLDYTVETGLTPLSAPFTFTPGTAGSGAGLSFTGQHVWSNWEVDYFLNLVQKSRQAQVMNAPRLTLFNAQRGYVAVTRNVTYVSNMEISTDTTVSDGVTVTTITIDTETTVTTIGVVLDVRPTVSADRRYVQMDLAPTLRSLELGQLDLRQFGATAGVVFLPTITTTAVRDTVSVPDGGTIMAGGLLFTSEVEGEAGVPILYKLPYIGWLFGRRAEAYTLDNILILVTPHIILQEEEEERVIKEAI